MYNGKCQDNLMYQVDNNDIITINETIDFVDVVSTNKLHLVYSHTHTHTHTNIMCVYIYIYI